MKAAILVALVVLVPALSPVAVDSLGFTPTALAKRSVRSQRRESLTSLSGWFDFNPIHGGGSGGNDDFLDEQWEAQQAILRARRGEGQVKENLRDKYKNKRQFDVKESAAPVPKTETVMYFADEQKVKTPPAPKPSNPPLQIPPFKFPWDKK